MRLVSDPNFVHERLHDVIALAGGKLDASNLRRDIVGDVQGFDLVANRQPPFEVNCYWSRLFARVRPDARARVRDSSIAERARGKALAVEVSARCARCASRSPARGRSSRCAINRPMDSFFRGEVSVRESARRWRTQTAAADALDGVKVNEEDAIFERGGEDASLVGVKGARAPLLEATKLAAGRARRTSRSLPQKASTWAKAMSTTVRPPVERASRDASASVGSGMDSAQTRRD